MTTIIDRQVFEDQRIYLYFARQTLLFDWQKSFPSSIFLVNFQKIYPMFQIINLRYTEIYVSLTYFNLLLLDKIGCESGQGSTRFQLIFSTYGFLEKTHVANKKFELTLVFHFICIPQLISAPFYLYVIYVVLRLFTSRRVIFACVLISR